MITISLKDGAVKQVAKNSTPLDLAVSISRSLAKSAIFALVNDTPQDLSFPLTQDCRVEILTKSNESQVLPLLRHDLAHIMGHAVVELFDDVKLGVGPDTENGFFYDFLSPTTFSEADLPKIEKRMHEIIKRKEPFVREVWTRQQAEEYFNNHGEILKLLLLKKIPQGEEITVYRQGSFLDLCKGPHAPNTGYCDISFKITKVSAVYWEGDKNSYSLQRIYGVAFLTKEKLKLFEEATAEALKRDHRKLAKEMDLFHFQEEAVGQAFWHPKGQTLYLTLQNYIREKLAQHGYEEVKTPQILSRSLWEQSGHWEKFSDDIFVVKTKDEDLAIKPMNCPAHIEIFKQGIKSYKNLPLRMAEFGSCFRNEPSGAMHGLMRVRGFVQDDAHIFCTLEQVGDEISSFVKLLKEVYSDLLGDINIIVKFSDRPEKRAGSDEVWDKSEKMLYEAARASGLELIVNKGEGAFYGPKLEFTLQDSLGRLWQTGTIQLDFVLPERLQASYIGPDGVKHTPVVLHRAILGSFERFIGIMLEHYAGKLPVWLAPLQVVVIGLAPELSDYCKDFFHKLKKAKVRAELDLRNEKIGYKIREHRLARVPLLVIIGNKEACDNKITIRVLSSDEQITLSQDEGLSYISNLCNVVY